MTRKTDSLLRLWKALNLLEDYVSTGFSRERPELVIEERDGEQQTMASAPAAQPQAPAQAAAAPGPAAVAPEPAAPASAQIVEASADRPGALAAIAHEISGCTKCGLCSGRTTTVPGEGPLDPLVMFIGEGPGEAEDKSGRPFVGAAGQYLDKWIAAIALRREQCFIANIVKCRPPRNREPHPEEMAACFPYLERQVQVVRPMTICCLGRISAQALLQTTASLGSLRGKRLEWKGIPLIVTYHPSAVLRDNMLRKPVWDDLRLLKTLLPGRAAGAPPSE